jgi:hypothetical protein
LPTGPTLRLSPEDVWRRTAALMAGQTSASLTLDLRDEQGNPVHAESSVASDGDCVGRISAGGGRAQVIHVRTTRYVKGDAAFWTWAIGQSGAAWIPEAWVDKWIKGSKAQLEVVGVATMCSLSDTVSNLTADYGGTKRETGPRNLLGVRAVTVTETGSSDSLTLDVAATGPATLLRGVRKTDGDPALTVTFTRLGAPVHAVAPAGAVGWTSRRGRSWRAVVAAPGGAARCRPRRGGARSPGGAAGRCPPVPGGDDAACAAGLGCARGGRGARTLGA